MATVVFYMLLETLTFLLNFCSSINQYDTLSERQNFSCESITAAIINILKTFFFFQKRIWRYDPSFKSIFPIDYMVILALLLIFFNVS